MKIAIVGMGSMGGALAAGLVRAGRSDLVAVVRPGTDRTPLEEAGFRVVTSVTEADADVIVVATKPHDAVAAVAPLAAVDFRGLIISVAAGIPLAAFEAAVGEVAVIRAMPNTPALVGAGITAVAAGRSAEARHLRTATELLQSVGAVVEVDEADLDAVTAVSGSGPAYVFLLAEALEQAAVQQGIRPEIAQRLAMHTIHGAGLLLVESGAEPAELRRRVTSPGGTTEAAVGVLEGAGWRSVLADAVEAATERSRQLGDSD